MNNGALLSNNILGILLRRRGTVTVTKDPAAKTPAFPKLVRVRSSIRSTIVTLWPALCSQIADDTPTIPAPATTTWAIFTLLQILLLRPSFRIIYGFILLFLDPFNTFVEYFRKFFTFHDIVGKLGELFIFTAWSKLVLQFSCNGYWSNSISSTAD